jgi:hypothetical protein
MQAMTTATKLSQLARIRESRHFRAKTKSLKDDPFGLCVALRCAAVRRVAQRCDKIKSLKG